MKKLLAALLLCLTVGAGATALPAAGTVEVLFTPWDDAEGAIVRVLGEARRSIHVQAYLLTSRSIAQALQSAQARGVAVEIHRIVAPMPGGDHSPIKVHDPLQLQPFEPHLALARPRPWIGKRRHIAHQARSRS